MSFGLFDPSGTTTLDGNSLLSLFVDWSAAQPASDVLYVVGGE